jgi:hypothetical protein
VCLELACAKLQPIGCLLVLSLTCALASADYGDECARCSGLAKTDEQESKALEPVYVRMQELNALSGAASRAVAELEEGDPPDPWVALDQARQDEADIESDIDENLALGTLISDVNQLARDLIILSEECTCAVADTGSNQPVDEEEAAEVDQGTIAGSGTSPEEPSNPPDVPTDSPLER